MQGGRAPCCLQVRVLVMTWNEKSNDMGLLEGMMGTHDEETLAYFRGTDVICTNVQRAKDSWLGLGGQFVSTLYTHHQKTVVCVSTTSAMCHHVIPPMARMRQCRRRMRRLGAW